MELLLNITWLVVSAALGVMLVASRSRREAASGERVCKLSAVWMCYLVLIALLLPAISMTDDMLAMVAPRDGEQISRRYEVSAAGQHHADFHPALFCAVRYPSHGPLVRIGILKAIPATRIFCLSPRQRTQGRAPPFAS